MESLPQSLNHLIHVNIEFKILICLGHGCQTAQTPTAISGHLYRKHKTPLELRKQVDKYIERWLWEYDYTTARLPIDGSVPQASIKIIDGFQCKFCDHKCRNRNGMREHTNKTHEKKRIADEELFNRVRLQSWFGDKRERYWVVDESQSEVDLGQELESRAGETHTR